MNNDYDGPVTIHGAWQAAIEREAAIRARRQEVLRARAEALRTFHSDMERLRAAIVAAFKPLMEWFAQLLDTIGPRLRAWLDSLAPAVQNVQHMRITAAKQRARLVTRAKALRRRKALYARR